MTDRNEIILYQPDEAVKLEVRLSEETVWLTINQMALLFDRDKSVISRHIAAIFKEGELNKVATVAKNATVQIESGRSVIRQLEYYNLDVIISVGYRVKSLRGTQFRQWANRVLKDYLLKGYAVNQRFERLEQRMTDAENKIDFFVRTNALPVEQVFFDTKMRQLQGEIRDLMQQEEDSTAELRNLFSKWWYDI